MTREVPGRQAAEDDMEKRSFRLYPFFSAVAAAAAAAFFMVRGETIFSQKSNLSITLFIYYTYMALNVPAIEAKAPVWSFIAVWKN